jgi:hypothetical protein
MTIQELIDKLSELDPNSKVYVPFTTHPSPAVEPEIIPVCFKDGEGVMLCAHSAVICDQSQ